MTITKEISLCEFEAWSGAVSTLDRINNEGKAEVLETVLEELYPEGMDETQLNDILWFESDWCFEMCGIRSETVIREELEEAREELKELMENFRDELEELRANATISEWNNGVLKSAETELWETDYKDDAEELKDKIAELEEELENI